MIVGKDRILAVESYSAPEGRHQTFTNHIGLLDAVEDHARASHQAGKSLEEAATDLVLPDSIGPVRYFRDGFHEIAMEAWYRILSE